MKQPTFLITSLFFLCFVQVSNAQTKFVAPELSTQHTQEVLFQYVMVQCVLGIKPLKNMLGLQKLLKK